MGKKSVLIINYISKSDPLISTFTWPGDYKKQEYHCKGSLFAMDVKVRGQNIRCFLGKYGLQVVKLKDCKSGSEVPKQLKKALSKS